MPTLITRGAASAKAFGFAGLNPVSVTFTANGTWVAPNNVTKVNMSGKGSDGVSDTWAYRDIVNASLNGSGGPYTNPPYLQYSYVYGLVTAQLSSINSSTLQRTVSTTDYYWFLDTSNNYSNPTTVYNGYTIRGTAVVVGYGSAATSGNVTYSPNNFAIWAINVEVLYPGGPGADATGLGKTFPGGAYSGGTGYPASTTTFTNVTVTPGASYSIVVPSGGSITISYSA